MPWQLTLHRISQGERPSIHRYYDVPCESPDGSKIVYFAFDGPLPGPGNVVVADRDGGNLRVVGRDDGLCQGHVGAQAIWTGRDTVHFTLHGKEHPATRFVDVSTGAARDLHGLIRSVHEGTAQAVVTHGNVNGDSDAFQRRRCALVEIMDTRTGERRPVLTVDQAVAVHPLRNAIDPDRMNLMNMKWSPDGSTLSVVFTDQIHCSMFGGKITVKCLMLVEVASGKVRYLNEFGHHPMWAPDGSYILAHMKNGASQDLVALPVDGGKPFTLIDNFTGIHTALDRAMKRAVTDAYGFEKPGHAAVLLYDLDTKQREVLHAGVHENHHHDDGTHLHPQWSRDERRILFNHADSGVPQLYAVDL